MTIANMRANGVRTLAAWCLGRNCGHSAVLDVAGYLDEVEYNLHCSNRFCHGGVRISLIHDDKNEGFVGGMA
jgi:hypothetical protein